MLKPVVWAVTAVGAQRIAELVHARRNDARLRAAGAVEHGSGHYRTMVALHVGWLAATAVEGTVAARTSRSHRVERSALAVFVAAQALRYAAIRALGDRWTTRILVLPDAEPVRTGPYRLVRHPNYVAVALELAALPTVFGARRTAVLATVADAALMAVRIPAEDRALGRRRR
ncbi:MAG: isoprenylcysteine carboxyl methyltransferase family protein [Acidimicrobiales bacterium]